MKVVRWALAQVRKVTLNFALRLYELTLIAAAAAAGTSVILWWEKIRAYAEGLISREWW